MFGSVIALTLLLDVAGTDEEKRTLWTAVDDVRRSLALYQAVLRVQPKLRPFPRVLRQKRRHLKRLLKRSAARGHGVPPVLWDATQIKVPPGRKAACARAVDQELRNAAIYETALSMAVAPSVGAWRSPKPRAELSERGHRETHRRGGINTCIAVAAPATIAARAQ